MNCAEGHTGRGPLSPQFWERTWQELQQLAPFKDSQEKHPQRWRHFYDQMASLWEVVTGGGPAAAQTISNTLAASGLLTRESSVLEIGCGSGSLALALAQRVKMITALDDSGGMLATLRDRAENLPPGKVLPVKSDWRDYEPKHHHHLVIAAFFPSAMTPAGLDRLEYLAHNTCALVVGTGHEAIPLRRSLWEKIMERPLPNISFQLPCALGYLLASGRRPDLKYISWQANLDLPREQVARFYESYFAIFGKTGPEIGRLIAEVLKAYTAEERLKLTGEASAALLTWPRERQSQ
ncbi:MAG: class I SAM-dependent methyltransferase [Desulfarculaceae bacterium]|jgi:SAM-dependent methyltransferase